MGVVRIYRRGCAPVLPPLPLPYPPVPFPDFVMGDTRKFSTTAIAFLRTRTLFFR